MPALVSFHERLMEHLPALVDLALETSGAAYDARRPKAVEPRPIACSLEALRREPSATSSRAWRHLVTARLRSTDLDAAVRSGARQIEAIAAYAAKLERAFAHKRVLLQELGDVIVICDAVVDGFDTEPEDEGGVEAVVTLTFHTHGTGDLDGTENPGG